MVNDGLNRSAMTAGNLTGDGVLFWDGSGVRDTVRRGGRFCPDGWPISASTRDQAIKVLATELEQNKDWTERWIDALIALDLLKVETTPDPDRIVAIGRLDGVYTTVRYRDNMQGPVQITREAAVEILDVLLKSGFKITRG